MSEGTIFGWAKGRAVDATLWWALKLRGVSKGVENIIGAERSAAKANGVSRCRNGGGGGRIADADGFRLSRPLGEIIEDTFEEELRRLSQRDLAVIKPGSVRSLRERLEGLGGERPANGNSFRRLECAERRLESAIQSTHEEIVTTLQLIVSQTEEIRRKLAGHRHSGSSDNAAAAMEEVRVLTLAHGEHQDDVLYRLRKRFQLQFRLGPSLLGRKVQLFTNYPKDNTEFKRNRYVQLHWLLERSNADDTALTANITLRIAGSYHYYFTYDDEKSGSTKQGSGYFIVDPTLSHGDGEALPLDAIQCQTVLAKGLGAFATWEAKLKVSRESGYNMLHFTPIQELGASNSSYSLKDHHRLNPNFDVDLHQLQEFLMKIRKDWKMTSICDIVLNHTANESAWILEHPEATYNCSNCAYMRPAYLLDVALHHFSRNIVEGVYEARGIPADGVSTEDHLSAIRFALKSEVVAELRLQELFVCDVKALVAEFANSARTKVPRVLDMDVEALRLLQDPEYRRFGSKVNMDLALRVYNVYRNDCFDEESRVKKCTEDFKAALDALNAKVVAELEADLNVAVDNIVAGIRYFRVSGDGPRIKELSEKTPLVYRYFTDYGESASMEESEELMYGLDGKYLMAHNGWVMDADPLRNFAADCKVYLRRELIAWGDSVKLRYGSKPEDCPFLWQHMRDYVETVARLFDGVRLDNCHSTPIPVAEYLLDCARKVKPDLYVVAELFTNSDHKDNIFINRLGINSLIREAMSAWDSHELGRLVHRYGGDPVGAFYQPRVRPLMPSIAHALFLDVTHDNPSPVEKRSVYDLLPSAALVSMACCASGSSRGYDELVPHHVHVVDEVREYAEWTEKTVDDDPRFVSETCGIIAGKRALNELHTQLGRTGFNQVFVDQMDVDIVAVTRHNPTTHESVILVAFTAFKGASPTIDRAMKPLQFEGELKEIIFEASLQQTDGAEFVRNDKYINGLRNYALQLKRNLALEESQFLRQKEANCLEFKPSFTRGCVLAIKVALEEKAAEAVKEMRDATDQNDLTEIVSSLTLADCNRVLYRCDREERDEGFGFAAYDIPGFGATVYCGLQGFMSLLASVRPANDLGHPMCDNLRQGDWMMDYVYRRLLVDDEGTAELGRWLERRMRTLKRVPRYLVPAYFDALVTGLYVLVLEHSLGLMSDFVKNGSAFVRALALGSVQFGACLRSAPLPELSPQLEPPQPPRRARLGQFCVSLSAGLPHFTTGYMRNWGRDTFIALRGLFILTGRYQEARYHILAYAACLRHGLIPNLLDSGKNSRFNCRDAVWWWLYCIQSYVKEAPSGGDILEDTVSRIFPNDEAPPQEAGTVEQKLCEVMQEALNVHFQGLAFRERHAGRKIDEHMSDKGFNNQIGVHPDTGFVFGGNEANCGTWMDKMGSSEKASNRGKPATPRDGSAVELVGLSKSVASWLHSMHLEKKYPYDGVERTHRNGAVTKWSFKEWAERIARNFENYFWVGATTGKFEKRPDLVNKRNIYKDCVGASQAWSDYQLRCNFPVAMVAAPELFDANHAWAALKTAGEHLLGPLGMKTLDADDWNYRGDYDNSDESNGFNYHQGPEWLWPVGYFLRAKLIFAAKLGLLKPTMAFVKEVLARHFTELQTSPWRGLPELTNSDGAFCRDSSATQAWSMAAVLEVLHDLQQIESKSPIELN